MATASAGEAKGEAPVTKVETKGDSSEGGGGGGAKSGGKVRRQYLLFSAQLTLFLLPYT